MRFCLTLLLAIFAPFGVGPLSAAPAREFYKCMAAAPDEEILKAMQKCETAEMLFVVEPDLSGKQ